MGFGNKKNKPTTTKCLIIGEDRKLMRRTLEGTGAFFLDNDNRLAFDSLPEGIGALTLVQGGKRRYLGQVSLLFEPMARPFSFPELNWAKVDHKEEIILAAARSEGSSKAVQSMEKKDKTDKMQTTLMLLSAGVIGMALLFALQSGVFSKLFGG